MPEKRKAVMASTKSALKKSAEALQNHQAPSWWRAAKLGIFIHWTPASIPAFAPTGRDMVVGEEVKNPRGFAESPYSEWYENSLRFPGSTVANHHTATYGQKPFSDFGPEWESGLAHWDPVEWASRFAATGARYVVLVAKHMEGYCLWPSAVPNPHRPNWNSSRDVVGELASAVRQAGMKFGLYYSGGFDATWNDHPIGSFGDVPLAVPRGGYPEYAAAQVRELIDRYQPSVLWNDICWPAPREELIPILEYYYQAVPDGVINDRFLCWSPLWKMARYEFVRKIINNAAAKSAKKEAGLVPPKPEFFDVRTPEYTTYDEIQSVPWECVRGMDHSFGYNRASRPEDFITRQDLLWSFSDIVAKGGNLLINIGPRGEDAQIPEPQVERLGWLQDFTAEAKDALFDTQPWSVAEGSDESGLEIRYTASPDSVHALVRGPVNHLRSLTFTGLKSETATSKGVALVCRNDNHGTTVEINTDLSPDVPLEISFPEGKRSQA